MTTNILLLLICAVTLPILVTGQCKPDSCKNNGTCEIGYKGKRHKCKCPNSDLLFYGPNCEIASIGFHASDESKRVRSETRINIYSSKVHLIFEFIGRCYANESSCRILSLTKPDYTPLLTVWMHKSSLTAYEWNLQFTNENNVTLGLLKGKINTNKWMTMDIKFHQDMIVANVIPVYPEEGYQELKLEQMFNELIDTLRISKLMLGGFYGCVRFVRIDEKLVDLGSFTLHNNTNNRLINVADHKYYASHFCYPTEKSCHSRTSQLGQRIFDSNSRTKCGANSKCDGVLDSGMECNCRCDFGKRRQLETLNNNDTCWRNLTKQDECIDDTTTVSTGQSDFLLKWEASDSNCLGISAHAFSIEFMVLTSQQYEDPILELISEGNISYLTIDIDLGNLQLCIFTDCKRFPPVSVSDDVGHEVSIVKQMNRVTLKNGETTIVTFPLNNQLLRICHCRMQLRNSCIRGFRISGVTMPVRKTDDVRVISGKQIVVKKGDGVSVDDHCDFNKTGLTPPTCDPICKNNEECDGPISGPPKCFCKKPFVKHGDICVDPLVSTSTIPTSTSTIPESISTISQSTSTISQSTSTISQSTLTISQSTSTSPALTNQTETRQSGIPYWKSRRWDVHISEYTHSSNILKSNWMVMITAQPTSLLTLYFYNS